MPTLQSEPRWQIVLPWQAPPLSLNDRGQSRGAREKRSATIAEVRQAVCTMARAKGVPAMSAIHVRLHWRPAVKRRRDPDNLVATLKPCLDGLVDAGVVPDDTQEYVDWSRPMIHPPDKELGPALWLVIRKDRKAI
jgi:crossover junction endodeoxyribonuclease RusA